MKCKMFGMAAFLLIWMDAAAFAYGLRIIEVNDDRLNVFDTELLPRSIMAEIKKLKEKNKPDISKLKNTKSLLQYYNLKPEAYVVDFATKKITKVKIKRFRIHYRKSKDCLNYPDLYITTERMRSLKNTNGIVLPDGARLIDKPAEISRLMPAVDVYAKKMAENYAAEATGEKQQKYFTEAYRKIVESVIFFTYESSYYTAFAQPLEAGGAFGRIQNGYFTKMDDFQMLKCGS